MIIIILSRSYRHINGEQKLVFDSMLIIEIKSLIKP
jgi:hypothetical protein